MLIVITGPPCAGKTTWAHRRAKTGDVIIDYDAIASALTPGLKRAHDYPPIVKDIALAMRQCAIDKALASSPFATVYLIHTNPSPSAIRRYRLHGAHIVELDPGIDETTRRCQQQRPPSMLDVVKQWYQNKRSNQLEPKFERTNVRNNSN